MTAVRTVALLGPDGAGKTTVARRLEREGAPFIRYIYMGVNPDSSSHLLPISRMIRAVRRHGGPATHAGRRSDAAGARDGAANEDSADGGRRSSRAPSAAIRSALRVANLVAEETYRQLLASYHVRRGRIVIFDRHFFADYHPYDIEGRQRRTLARRAHGLFLDRLYPRPDLAIYLDAPAAVLLARKHEGTLETLEQKRREYVALAPLLPRFLVVDASRPVDAVVDEIMEHLCILARGGGAWLPFCSGHAR